MTANKVLSWVYAVQLAGAALGLAGWLLLRSAAGTVIFMILGSAAGPVLIAELITFAIMAAREGRIRPTGLPVRLVFPIVTVLFWEIAFLLILSSWGAP